MVCLQRVYTLLLLCQFVFVAVVVPVVVAGETTVTVRPSVVEYEQEFVCSQNGEV